MLYIDHRGVAQSGSASALGAEGRRFESSRPDQFLGGYDAEGSRQGQQGQASEDDQAWSRWIEES